MNDDAVKQELCALIFASCGKTPYALSDEEPLFGPDSRLALDSLDALQISVMIKKRFGLRLTDSKEMRRIMINLASFAEYIQNQINPLGKT